MNYRLKKDLPFAKAGSVVDITGSKGCVPLAIYEHRKIKQPTTVSVSREYVDELISEGWIVKTGEWWVIYSRESNDFYYGDTFDTEEDVLDKIEEDGLDDDHIPMKVKAVDE